MWFFKKKDKLTDDKVTKKEHGAWWHGLRKTSAGFFNLFQNLSNNDQESVYSTLEEQLLMADLGPKLTKEILDVVRAQKKLKTSPAVLDAVKGYLVEILKKNQERKLNIDVDADKPLVYLFIGVNGAGKTTTIGKLGQQLVSSGKKVMFAAGDTFRAAAVEQLKIWGEKLGVPVVSQGSGADSAAVIFDAYQSAKARKYDFLLVDTAGRLHNKDNLMNELKKIEGCLKKQKENLPQEVVLVLDASIGQNGLRQVEEFSKNLKVSGLIITKLDGSAKGGAIFAISKLTNLPIYYVGVGEKSEDLILFDAEKFVEALFEG